MLLHKTPRGHNFLTFHDDYGTECYLLESSSALENKIWFGTSKDKMNFTQQDIKELLPYLETFAKTGKIA